MTQWGRKENYSWPSRRPLALITALLLAAAATIATAFYDYQHWTLLQQAYLKPYLNSVTHPWIKPRPLRSCIASRAKKRSWQGMRI